MTPLWTRITCSHKHHLEVAGLANAIADLAERGTVSSIGVERDVEMFSQNHRSKTHLRHRDGTPVKPGQTSEAMISAIEASIEASRMSLFLTHFANALAKNKNVTRHEVLNDYPHTLIGAIVSGDWHYDQQAQSFLIDTSDVAIETIKAIFIGLFGVTVGDNSLTSEYIGDVSKLIYNCGWYTTSEVNGVKVATITKDFPGFEWYKGSTDSWLVAVIKATVGR
jgi:hypothetical protein